MAPPPLELVQACISFSARRREKHAHVRPSCIEHANYDPLGFIQLIRVKIYIERTTLLTPAEEISRHNRRRFRRHGLVYIRTVYIVRFLERNIRVPL